jgi:hypothetical protein
MTARDDLTNSTVIDRAEANQLIDALIAERDAEIVAWLGKKAKEFRSAGGQQRQAQADAVDAMASKLARGAVRPDNMRGVVTRNEVLHEAASIAATFLGRFPDWDAMKAAGIIGPHTMARAIGNELRRMADAGQVGTVTAPSGETTQPASFFQAGHTYGDAEYDWKFRCDTVTTHPENGERTALGWRFFNGEWEPYAYHEDDWEIHQLVGHTDSGRTTQPAPGFFQPGHGYTHRYGHDFLCAAITTHPATGERLAIGWRIRHGVHYLAAEGINQWNHEYDGVEPPAEAPHPAPCRYPAGPACTCMAPAPHPKLPCGHCAMDLCEDCKTCAACPHTCNEGGAA